MFDSVCVAGIVRIPLLAEVKPYDVSWTIVDAGIWINVECNIGIVSACLPIMRPLLNRVPKSFTSRFSESFSNPFSWRSSKLTASASRSGELPNKKGKKVPQNTVNNTTKASYQSQWPKDSHGSTGSESTKVETYRSTAEGYPDYGSENEDWKEKQRSEYVGRNRSLWVDDQGRGRTLYSSEPPFVRARDEEMGGIRPWTGNGDEVPMRATSANRWPAGYERMF